MPAPAVTQPVNQVETRSTRSVFLWVGKRGSLQFRSCKPCIQAGSLGPYPPLPRPFGLLPLSPRVTQPRQVASPCAALHPPGDGHPSAPLAHLPSPFSTSHSAPSSPPSVRQAFSYSEFQKPKIALDNYHFLRFQEMALCGTPPSSPFSNRSSLFPSPWIPTTAQLGVLVKGRENCTHPDVPSVWGRGES